MEYKETKLPSAEKFTLEAYTETGVYRNLDELGAIEWILANIEGKFCVWMGGIELDNLFMGDPKPKKSSPIAAPPPEGINENTLLRAIAVASGYVKYDEI